ANPRAILMAACGSGAASGATKWAKSMEHAPWPASEAREMEAKFDTAPRTPRDLQLAALRRISDINHSLHHDEFAQGQTVKALPNEREVQKWVANELKHRKGRAYTLMREPHVADEKEPDIRFQSQRDRREYAYRDQGRCQLDAATA